MKLPGRPSTLDDAFVVTDPDNSVKNATADPSAPAATESTSRPSRGHFWIRRLGALGRVATAAAALVQPVARLCARLDWRADLLVHFQDAAIVVTIIAIAATIRRWPLVAFTLVAVAVWQASALWTFNGVNPVPAVANRTSPRIRLLVANVLCTNRNYAQLERLIKEERPDIVGLVEVSPEWIEGLHDIRAEYPFRAEVPWGAFGLALWFRRQPIRVDPPAQSTPGGWPFLHAVFRFEGRDRELWLAHPSSPLRASRKIRGYPELITLAERVRDASGSRIVAGDFNTSEASPYFGDLLAISGLRDSRRGFGRQPTWPSMIPLRVAIDHVLVSDDWAVLDRRVGNSIGSDHFPLILDLGVAAGAEADASAVKAPSSHGQSVSVALP